MKRLIAKIDAFNAQLMELYHDWHYKLKEDSACTNIIDEDRTSLETLSTSLDKLKETSNWLNTIIRQKLYQHDYIRLLNDKDIIIKEKSILVASYTLHLREKNAMIKKLEDMLLKALREKHNINQRSGEDV